MLKAREFHQIAGRAGRAGFDTAGARRRAGARARRSRTRRPLAKAGDDPKKRRQVVRKKPPEGFVVVGRADVRPARRAPSPSRSRRSSAVTHAMVLNVIARPGDAVRRDARACSPTTTRPSARSASTSAAPSRSTARCSPPASSSASTSPTTDGRTVRLTVDLPARLRAQPAAVAVRARRARAARPRVADVRARRRVGHRGDPRRPAPGALRAAVQGARRGRRGDEGRGHRVRGADGAARGRHATRSRSRELLERGVRDLPRGPPVGRATTSCAPKSVVRDMFERAMTFAEYVALLRASPAPRASCCATSPTPTARCARPCPTTARTEELDDLIEWLGELVRQVDSSLLDEWEQLRDRHRRRRRRHRAGADRRRRRVTANTRAFRVLVRNALFRRVELAARRDWRALGELDAADGWGADEWREALEPYFDEHDDDRHRPRRPRPGAAHRSTEQPGQLGRAADPRRPGRRPRLGLHRRWSTSPPPTRPARPCSP